MAVINNGVKLILKLQTILMKKKKKTSFKTTGAKQK